MKSFRNYLQNVLEDEGALTPVEGGTPFKTNQKVEYIGEQETLRGKTYRVRKPSVWGGQVVIAEEGGNECITVPPTLLRLAAKTAKVVTESTVPVDDSLDTLRSLAHKTHG